MRRAWEHVSENAGCAGADGVSVRQFQSALRENLRFLQADIRSGAYRPWPLLRIEVAKRDGGARTLTIPPVRDRVAQTSVHLVLQPVFEAEFESCSFGYRPGVSVRDAVVRIREYHEQGYRWVVDADIAQFFDSIDHARLLARVARIVGDRDVLRLLQSWMRAVVWDGNALSSIVRGVPQGVVTSPSLANLFLDDLDESLCAQGFKLVRYADDFIVLCRTRADAERALEVTDDLVAALDLELNEAKTAIRSFDTGFTFLGVTFEGSRAMRPFETVPPRRGILSYPRRLRPGPWQAYILGASTLDASHPPAG